MAKIINKNNGFIANKTAEAEAKAKEAESKVKPVKPADLPETMKAIKSKVVQAVRDENGYMMGVTGGPKLTKILRINGMMCLCHGDNEKELEADIKAAKEASKYINQSRIGLADNLVEAGYKAKDIEEITSKCGGTYVLDYSSKEIRSTSGELVVDLSDLKSITDRADIKKLLVDRLNKKVDAEGDYDDCYDDDDGTGPYTVYNDDDEVETFDDMCDAVDCAYEQDGDYHTYIEDRYGDVVWDSDEDC